MDKVLEEASANGIDAHLGHLLRLADGSLSLRDSVVAARGAGFTLTIQTRFEQLNPLTQNSTVLERNYNYSPAGQSRVKTET
ncbi:hypothetical protein CQ018_12775 [Arthrobacter sp. MYb227]|nr:hypothetical protein CQ018_12775 [Arthrobacter sp. MYb227]